MNRRIGIYFLIGIILIFLGLFVYYIWYRYNYVTTDAIFVQADRMIYVSFTKVNGRIIKLYKREGERVEEGEILAELEPRDYFIRLRQVEEELGRIDAEKRSLILNRERLSQELQLRLDQTRRQIEAIRNRREAKKYQIDAVKARLELIRKDRERLQRLYQEGLISLRDLELKETEERELGDQLRGLLAEYTAMEKDIEVLERTLQILENEFYAVKALQAQVEALRFQKGVVMEKRSEAELFVEYTVLRSPLRGYIAKKFHSEGDVVGPGEPIYAIVDPESFYILVLLEETKLSGVTKGARAKIKLDAYPGKTWEGEVEEILPASSATFALVPRDISAGEFTKLAQRIPVRVKILSGDRSLLRVGLGGSIEIKRSR